MTSAVGKGSTFSLIMPISGPHQAIEVHSTLENA
jgi:hypothetical protein